MNQIILEHKSEAMHTHKTPPDHLMVIPDNSHLWSSFCREATGPTYLANENEVHPYWHLLRTPCDRFTYRMRIVHHADPNEFNFLSLRTKDLLGISTMTVCFHPYHERGSAGFYLRGDGDDLEYLTLRGFHWDSGPLVLIPYLREVRLFDCQIGILGQPVFGKLVMVNPTFTSSMITLFYCNTFVLRNQQGTIAISRPGNPREQMCVEIVTSDYRFNIRHTLLNNKEVWNIVFLVVKGDRIEEILIESGTRARIEMDIVPKPLERERRLREWWYDAK